MASAGYKRRVKRDSATNLYNRCQVPGSDCPPDVVNKIEHNTLADKLLRIFSSIAYFGGLGIGTGKGSGGSGGYVPLAGESGGVRVGSGGSILRPAVPLDLGPVDVLPVDAVAPSVSATDSSIIPLLEGGPEVGVDLGPNDVEVIVNSDPVSDLPGIVTSTVSTEDTAAVLETGSSAAASASRVTRTQYHNPAFIALTSSTPTVGESTAGDSIVIAFESGGLTVGGGDTIEMQNLSSSLSLDTTIDNSNAHVRTSTPGSLARLTQATRGLLNPRRYQQIRIADPVFLQRPADLAVFDNPAYDPDVSIELPLQSESPVAAPHTDFADIVHLGRNIFSETAEGRVRVSRVGTRGTVRLRSGLRIGAQVHYYTDMSTIDSIEGIELNTFGEHTGDVSIVQGAVDTAFVDLSAGDTPDLYSEEALLDEPLSDFSESQLVIGGDRETTRNVPAISTTSTAKYFLADVGDGLIVAYPQESATNDIILPLPGPPTVLLDVFSSGDFFLHPSHLRRRKRKRPL
ncbi:MAG: L2 protein [Varecia variegata papillomavirus 1]|nr:MAG: L2 protein [Varecia variegata papillomavirus 1]